MTNATGSASMSRLAREPVCKRARSTSRKRFSCSPALRLHNTAQWFLMRWHILRTLLHKEVLRHLANRSGLILVALLVAASLLLSFFGNSDGKTSGLAPGIQRCFVDCWEESPLIIHLQNH